MSKVNMLVGAYARFSHENANYGAPYPEDRGSGRSTAQALYGLAQAIAAPGTKVALIDHFCTPGADRFLGQLVQSIADKLELKFVVVSDTPRGVSVISNHMA